MTERYIDADGDLWIDRRCLGRVPTPAVQQPGEQDARAGAACIPVAVLREHRQKDNWYCTCGYGGHAPTVGTAEAIQRRWQEAWLAHLAALAPAQGTAEGPLTAWERRFRAQERESERTAGVLPPARLALLRETARWLADVRVTPDRRFTADEVAAVVAVVTGARALLAGQPDAEGQ